LNDNSIDKKRTPAPNSRFAKAGVSCFYDSEVLNLSFVHLMKFSAKTPRHRKPPKRYQNYPNPFNPSTTISFSISERSFVTLKVYDMLGREVTELVNEELESGNFEKTFEASSLASGVYIYRITAMMDGKILFSESRQMLLIK